MSEEEEPEVEYKPKIGTLIIAMLSLLWGVLVVVLALKNYFGKQEGTMYEDILMASICGIAPIALGVWLIVFYLKKH